MPQLVRIFFFYVRSNLCDILKVLLIRVTHHLNIIYWRCCLTVRLEASYDDDESIMCMPFFVVASVASEAMAQFVYRPIDCINFIKMLLLFIIVRTIINILNIN